MTKSASSFEKRADCLMHCVLALLGFGLGGLLVESALEGANVLPHLMLRAGIVYTAYQAVAQLLMGQVCLLCGLGAVFLVWKRV